MSASPGTPLGVTGHIPTVPRAAGVAPWCSCGYRWNPSDPQSELVGKHIARIAAERGEHIGTPGSLL